MVLLTWRQENTVQQMVAVLVLFAGLWFTATAQERPNFSGIWKMDPGRSESAHQAVPIGPVTLVIKQSTNEITIETRRTDKVTAAVSAEIINFKLDGSEITSTGTARSPIKASAHWDGTKLVTETARILEGSTFTTLHVLSLDANKRELTIHKTLTIQHGYQGQGAKNSGTGSDVYVKVKVPK